MPGSERAFAHARIDSGRVDCVHGHWSHHAKGIEVYRDWPIIYGCGDFLNDYEGISGHEHYRGDLSLLYFVTVDSAKHKLSSLQIVPAQCSEPQRSDADQGDTHGSVDRGRHRRHLRR